MPISHLNHDVSIDLHKVPAAKIQFLPEDRLWIADRIQEVLSTGQLTLGKYGTILEEQFATFCGTKYAIAVNSGTSALEIILRCLDVNGKDVLIPTNTFFATAAAVIHAGGRPIFVDMDPESFGMCPEDLKRKLTTKSVGLILVHIGGIVSHRLPEILDWATRQGLWVSEDAAHAHGSALRGIRAGAFGQASSFSFYPTKVMTSAEGGMIVTNDLHLAEEARIYRDQGKASFTQNAHVRMGYNWRLSEPHAIIGLKHLQRLPSMIADRQHIAAMYDEHLKDHPGITPVPIPVEGSCNYYKYLVVLKQKRDRKSLKAILRESYGVSLSGEVYEEPLHKQPVFQPYATHPLPVADFYCANHLCLPIYSGMEDQEAHQVIQALNRVLR